MNIDFEPSVEFGKFLVSATCQAIREFVKIKGGTPDDIINRVKTWHPLIIQLDYFKLIHNLTQKYVITINNHLLENFTKDTSLPRIQSAWKTTYNNDFKKEIDDFKIETDTFLEALNKVEKEPTSTIIFKNPFYTIQKKLDKVESHSQQAYDAMLNFVSEIEKVAENIRNGDDMVNIEAWPGIICPKAHDASVNADSVIVNLIPILLDFYEKTIVRPK